MDWDALVDALVMVTGAGLLAIYASNLIHIIWR